MLKSDYMVALLKMPRLVGAFIRQRRESAGLSQRALGLLFTPPVTTQFISNVERGVTPLPPSHVPILTRVLQIVPDEILKLLEKEYTFKLNGRIGSEVDASNSSLPEPPAHQLALLTDKQDHDFMSQIYQFFRNADTKTKQEFKTLCENLIKSHSHSKIKSE